MLITSSSYTIFSWNHFYENRDYWFHEKKICTIFSQLPYFFLPSSCQLRILLFSPFIHWFRSMKKNPEMFEKFKAFVESEKEKKRRESMENQSMLDLLNNSLKRERKRSTSRYVRYYKYIILLLNIYVL